GLGICKRWDDMRRLAKKAKEQVAARVGFFTKHLNIWVQGEKAWMDMARWEKCRDDWDGSTSANWSMWLGVDLSNKIDISAAVKVWLAPNGDVYVRSRFWIPEGRLEACSKQQADLYRKWNLAGFLEFTDGDVVDHAVIKEETIEWARGDSLNEFAYDPWSATQFALSVAAEGVPIVEVPQTVKNLSEAMKEVEAKIYAGRFHHDGNPVMT
ncbi:TPA: terminase large subunit, partial [Klebsiella pneumoniae]|nr:terminase large subunit [Klebsiella pneumoniae]